MAVGRSAARGGHGAPVSGRVLDRAGCGFAHPAELTLEHVRPPSPASERGPSRGREESAPPPRCAQDVQTALRCGWPSIPPHRARPPSADQPSRSLLWQVKGVPPSLHFSDPPMADDDLSGQ
eukprot:2566829-Prymnesium_polylepis.1